MAGRTIWENVIIFVLLGVVVCFITPIIQAIVYKTQMSAAESNTESLVKIAKELYADLNREREVNLPFTVSFNEDQTYNLYENTTKIAENQSLTSGETPTSGNIIIDQNGDTTAKNIQFGNIVCNLEGEQVICTRNK